MNIWALGRVDIQDLSKIVVCKVSQLNVGMRNGGGDEPSLIMPVRRRPPRWARSEGCNTRRTPRMETAQPKRRGD